VNIKKYILATIRNTQTPTMSKTKNFKYCSNVKPLTISTIPNCVKYITYNNNKHNL
jgi:hypothetical protein